MNQFSVTPLKPTSNESVLIKFAEQRKTTRESRERFQSSLLFTSESAAAQGTNMSSFYC